MKIIIAEDDRDERRFIQKGFELSGLFEIQAMVRDGQELVDKVRSFAGNELPDLILSDVNMPLKNGFEALAELKTDPNFKHIPFLMFSTSNSPSSMETCKRLGGAGYLIKPATFLEYETFARKLHEKAGSLGTWSGNTSL